MSLRRSMALNLSPLLLRLALGMTFLYAGWGKVIVKSEFQPEQLAVLANMGFEAARDAAVGGTPVEAAPLEKTEPPSNPADALPEPEARGRAAHGGHVVLARQNAPAQATPAPSATTRRVYTASDFEQPARLRMLHYVGLGLYGAAHPEDGKRRLLPPELVEAPWGSVLSWCAALTELVGGVLLIIGLLSRLAALGIAFVMGVAMWLTSIGPNIGAPDAFLGILPPLEGFQSDAWTSWMLQFALFCAAVSVLLTGPGVISLDGFIFGRRADRRAAYEADDEDDE